MHQILYVIGITNANKIAPVEWAKTNTEKELEKAEKVNLESNIQDLEYEYNAHKEDTQKISETFRTGKEKETEEKNQLERT